MNIPEFTISRIFAAPRDLVWACFTEVGRMTDWWGPKGVTIIRAKMDFRVGGIYHYGMQQPDGAIFWGRQVYRAIEPQHRLVFINSFSDEHGGLGRHPLAPTWPAEMHAVYTFSDEGAGTRLQITWKPHNASAEEIAAFAGGIDSMTNGWTGTLDKLTAYLANA